MSDLETALRAKLDEILRSTEAGTWYAGEEIKPQYYRGKNDVLKWLYYWLDSRPDGWHSLRENPEDLPDCHTAVWVIVSEKYWSKYYIYPHQLYHDGKSRWSFSCGYLDSDEVPLAWKYVEKIPTIPVRFQAQETE